MKITTNNAMMALKNIVTDGTSSSTKGFFKTAEGINISTLRATAGVATLTDNSTGTAGATIEDVTGTPTQTLINNNFASVAAQINGIINYLKGTADETNAQVLKIEETVDTVGHVVWKVPRDFDEGAQEVTLRVLTSQLTSSTDNDVELDLEVYHKTPGSALSADRNPTKPGTILSTTEQWVEFDLSTIFGTNNVNRDDVLFMEIITNGANDTDGEEVLIHDVELVYRSSLVSYDKETSFEAFDLR